MPAEFVGRFGPDGRTRRPSSLSSNFETNTYSCDGILQLGTRDMRKLKNDLIGVEDCDMMYRDDVGH